MSEKLAKRRTKEGSWEKPRVQIAGTQGAYRGEVRSVDTGAGGQRAVTEDVSHRLAVEDQRDGVDEDPDTNDFDPPKFNRAGKRDNEPGGSGSGPSGGREEPVAQLGIFTRFKNYLHRK